MNPETALGDLCALSATEMVAAVKAKEVSPVELTAAVLQRVERLNPVVNAVVTLAAEQAQQRAQAAEQAVMRGDRLGKLHGVPFTIKDLTETKGIRTTFGSKIFADHVPDEDAVLVERLRDAGGVLTGKTNTPQLGCKGVTDNLVFGATLNPWDLSVTPGGSSGGASAAVACGMGPLAEGTDFAGSIRIPASFCGLVGLKPSEGRVPIYPNNMIWHPITDNHGPITRTVADAALMLDVMAGPDDRDPRSLGDSPDFSSVVTGDLSLTGTRMAWLDDLGFVPVDPVVRSICVQALRTFELLGCAVDSVATDFTDSIEPYSLLNANRRGALIDPYLPERINEVDPLMVFRAELGRRKSATDAASAEMVQAAIYKRVRQLFQHHDLLVLPTTPTAAFPIGVDYPTTIAGRAVPTPFHQLGLTYLFNMTGHPAISVPAGWTPDGLPVGLQIVGPWRDDAAVLRAAAAFEQAAPWRHRWPDLDALARQ